MFKEELKRKSRQVEDHLVNLLSRCDMPEGLRAAMNYSLLAGGKRIRPVLCLSTAGLFGLKTEAVLDFASGIECIHTYSLIHDDLPAMDDDDLRRGKASNHKQFNEATAILAGDALLTDAFSFMGKAGITGSIPAGYVLQAMAFISDAAGSSGMVGGQFLDMEYTARKDVKIFELARMQAAKTGALLAASCSSGAALAGASAEELASITEYGSHLGAAFQIVDDILDEIGDSAIMGKATGSDAAQGKITYVSLLGLEASRKLADETGKKALGALSGYSGPEVEFLRNLVEYVLQRVF